ncbi:GNAT family N-acetyltransferase [Streptomyces lonegramiae]|uniref:GNAT family N-acetyltransferase n=1 Tax=Streptomyces lonegramiae TaxID=3075524 RepID=A0ABU2XLX7_9ACTN|nr:GNAT family N-acetyltransferase [Streptomyces sp. DSM 41529]MDT0546920.1 GNAT family N-acetyltransferase [Streptomyces sp. DSM 41529]
MSLVRIGDVDSVWDDLVGIYKECWAHKLHLPHYAPETFGERLHRHAAEPGWEAVVAYDSGEPIGYLYANRLTGADDRWWRRTRPEPEPAIARASTVAVKEMMVRRQWRGQGLARRLHDALLAGRPEAQVTLMVNPLNQDGKVQALYASWGYAAVGTARSSPEAPVLTVMARSVRSERAVG